MPRAIKYILYCGLFGFSFLIFTYWMFPMEAVKGRIITAFETALGPGYVVQIKDIDTYWFTGARLHDLDISYVAQGKEEQVLHADVATARVGLFSLLFGGPTINFDGKVGKMRIGGKVHRSDQIWAINTSFSNIDLGQVPLIRQKTGLNVSSVISGDVELNYDAKQPLRTTGQASIDFDKIFLKAGDVPLGEMGTFPLPDLSLASSHSVLKMIIERGAMNMETFQLTGDDLKLDLSGKVFLAPEVSKYRMNLQGKIQLSPKIWNAIDPILPEPWLVDLRKQKSPDDTYPISVSGQLSDPQIYSGTVAIVPFKPF